LESEDLEQGRGSIESRDFEDPYRKMIRERIGRLSRPLKVVVDAGNGTSSDLSPEVYRELGCEVIELFCEMDGSFPNHHPDPTVEENLRDLVAAVRVIAQGEVRAVGETERRLVGDDRAVGEDRG
ncbi:MAG: hypothetical protein IH921_13455, partial [Gemmatimonadetes bacterium]|nr:hypothetical protein [Gemmatimonadota bacterium]